MAEYTFYPKFQEYIALYRGVTSVWIGDGDETGIAGMLYAQYIDGVPQAVGYVSDYEEAKSYIPDLTYDQWVEILMAVPSNAVQAHTDADRAAMWASGSTEGTGDATHNAKEWARQASVSEGIATEAAQSCTTQINAKLDEINAATSAANTATQQANTARDEATAAAQNLEGITSTTETLPPMSNATSSVTRNIVDNHYILNLGIPQGVKGDKGEPNYLCPTVTGTALMYNWSADQDAVSARTIYYDTRVANPETLYEKMQPITNASIDALFT